MSWIQVHIEKRFAGKDPTNGKDTPVIHSVHVNTYGTLDYVLVTYMRYRSGGSWEPVMEQRSYEDFFTR